MTNISAKQPIITPAVSNILFSSNFASATALSAWSSASGEARKQFSGVDAETGFRWPTEGLPRDPGLQSYGANIVIFHNYNTAATIVASPNSYGTVTIDSAIGPFGASVNQMTITLLDSGLIDNGSNVPYGAQMHLEIPRVSGSGYVPPDIPDIYMSYWFKRPASMLSAMPVGQASVQWDFKSGGYNNEYGGDFRIVQELYKGADGLLYSLIRADRAANGTMTTDPGGILPFDAINSSGVFRYWQEIDKAVSVPVDTWNKLEIYIHRHQTNGICLAAINDNITCYHVGRTLGEFENPWGRMYVVSDYSPVVPNSHTVCMLRIHDYPPAGSVLQMPAASLLYRYAA